MASCSIDVRAWESQQTITCWVPLFVCTWLYIVIFTRSWKLWLCSYQSHHGGHHWQFLNFRPQIGHLKRRFPSLEPFRRSCICRLSCKSNSRLASLPHPNWIMRSFNILTSTTMPAVAPPHPRLHSSLGSDMFLLAYFWATWICFSPFWLLIFLICFGSIFAGIWNLPLSHPLTNQMDPVFYLSSLLHPPLIQSNPAGFISAPSHHGASHLFSGPFLLPFPLFSMA